MLETTARTRPIPNRAGQLIARMLNTKAIQLSLTRSKQYMDEIFGLIFFS